MNHTASGIREENLSYLFDDFAPNHDGFLCRVTPALGILVFDEITKEIRVRGLPGDFVSSRELAEIHTLALKSADGFLGLKGTD